MANYLAIDLLRTKLKYALISDCLDIIEVGNEYIPIDSKDELFDTFLSVTDRYRDDIEGVSVTMPGVIDRKRGFAYSGGVFEWVKDMDYAKELSEYIEMPVVICNDAKAAAMAEIGYGALKNIQNGVLLLILNTGIGGTVVTDGHILEGQHFAAGEFSYIRGDYKERDGTSDMFAFSANVDTLSKCVEEETGQANMNILRIISKLNTKDEKVTRGVEKFCDMLATNIYNLQCVLDCDVVVLGGHVADDPIMFKMVRQAVDRKFDNAPYHNIFKPAIKECIFHHNSRTYGAVYNFKDLMNNKE